ncbi:MAG: hypothetical protein KTR30_27685 [Saprospiraceae bacterium]|nr:hypothetical protein [Saprospiraceae bacterium]
MSLRNVCFIPVADLQQPEWNKISRSTTNHQLLEGPIQQGFTHLLLQYCQDTQEILSGIGLTQEVISAVDGKSIQVLRLGLPFGNLNADHLGVLFSFLIRHSFRTWYKSGCKPLYWWTAADHEIYAMIARFSMRFYPSRKYLMLSSISWLQERLGRKHFGESYSTYTGTISAHNKKLAMAGASPAAPNWLDQVDPDQWRNPDYSYFLDINSGAVRGNTLLVLMPFNITNMLVMQLKISANWLKGKFSMQAQEWRAGVSRYVSPLWRKEAQVVDQILSEE